MVLAFVSVLAWLPPAAPQDPFEELIGRLLGEDDGERAAAMRALARDPEAGPRLERRQAEAADQRVRDRLQEAIRAWNKERRLEPLLDRLSSATREWYRPIAERILAADPADLDELLRATLPGYFGDPTREEFRIAVCAVLRVEGNGREWDRLRGEGLRLLRLGTAHPESIETAAALLRDESPETRASAAYTLAALQAVSAAGRIAQLIRDPDAGVRREAARALQLLRASEHAPSVAGLLSDPIASVRSQAALAVARLGGIEHAPRIAALLKDRLTAVRVAAARGLGILRASEFAAVVAEGLDDPTDEVRLETLEALGDMGAESQVERISAELDSHGVEVRAKAAEVLARMGARSRAGAIAALLSDPDPRARAAGLSALGTLGEARHIPAVAARLDDAEPWVRRAALQALARLGASGPISERIVRMIASDADPLVTTAALRAAGELRIAEAAPIAAECTRPDYLSRRFGARIHLSMGGMIRAEATDALGRAGGPKHVPTIAALVEDTDASVRRAVARALVRLSGLEQRDALTRLLNDPDPSVGFEAMMALNVALAPSLMDRLQTEQVDVTEGSLRLSARLEELESRLAARISPSPSAAGLLDAPLPLPEGASGADALHALAREARFKIGVLLDPDARAIRILTRPEALAEFERILEAPK